MSAASGTIFTYRGPGTKKLTTGADLLDVTASPTEVNAGSIIELSINIGLLGVAVLVTGTYVGTMAIEVSQDHAQTWQQIDSITSQQITKIYTFPQNGPVLYTDFRVRGLMWTNGNAIVDIQPWNPLAVPTVIGSAGVPQPSHAPDTFHSIAASAAGNTAVWTPAAGRKFRLLQAFIQPSFDALLAVAGDLVVDLWDNNTSIGLAISFFCAAPGVGRSDFPAVRTGPRTYRLSVIAAE